MTIDFGDADPEDAWDASDPVVIRLALLAQVLVSIYEEALGGNVPRASARKAAIRPAVAKLIDELNAELAS